MLASPADWISPGRNDGYAEDPPAWEGRKVSLLDTDHVWGVGGNPGWAWKAFLRGHNPLFMDPYDQAVIGRGSPDDWELLRTALGQTRRLAERVDLTRMAPRTDLASSRYCLANPGIEYIVFLPDGGEVDVDLAAANGPFAVEWIHPVQGTNDSGTPEEVSGGAERKFAAPFEGAAVLYLRRP